MRLCILLVCLLGGTHPNLLGKFMNVVKNDAIEFSEEFTFEKAYSNFKKNYRKQLSEKQVGKTYKIGLSAVDMLSRKQFRKSLGGRIDRRLKLPLFVSETTKGRSRIARNNKSSLKKHMRMFDAVKMLKVNEVVNQGMCGNCYLHAAIAAIEVAYGKISGRLIKFSEQELTDCYYRGCNGGDYRQVSKTLAAVDKLSSREKYGDYLSKVDQCRSTQTPDNLDVMKLEGALKVTPDTVEAAIMKHGSVMACMDWENKCSRVRDYKSGIFEGPESQYCDHAILIVGFTPSYYKVRNSHGKSWGEGGYIRIRRGNTCGIENNMAVVAYSSRLDKGNMNNGCPPESPIYCSTSKTCTSTPCLTSEAEEVVTKTEICVDDYKNHSNFPCDKMEKLGLCDDEKFYPFCYKTCDKCEEFYKMFRKPGSSNVPLGGKRHIVSGPCNVPAIKNGRVISKTTIIESGVMLEVECDKGYTRTGGDVVCIVQDSFGPDSRLMPECHEITDAAMVGNGANYTGSVSYSVSGKRCLQWNKVILSGEYQGSLNRRLLMLGNHNFCRNPSGIQVAPMCIVDGFRTLEFCFSKPGCDVCADVTVDYNSDESCNVMGPYCSFEYQNRSDQYRKAWRECPFTCCLRWGCYT